MDLVFQIEAQLLDEQGDEFLNYVATRLSAQGYQGVVRITPLEVDLYQRQFLQMQDAANDDYFDNDDEGLQDAIAVFDQAVNTGEIDSSPDHAFADVRERRYGTLAYGYIADQLDQVPDELAHLSMVHDLCDLFDVVAIKKECEIRLADLDPDLIANA